MKIEVEGYPELSVILAHFNAIPILIEEIRKKYPCFNFYKWDRARSLDQKYSEISLTIKE